MVEQAGSSIIDHHDRWRWLDASWESLRKSHTTLMLHWELEKVFTWFGAFGHASAKPTQLWGTAPFIHSFKRSRPKSKKDAPAKDKLCITIYDANGCKKVYGNKTKMKASQEYSSRALYKVPCDMQLGYRTLSI